MPELDTTNVPHAAHMTVGMCQDPECSKLHIIMFDEDEKPMAVGAIDNPVQVIKLLQHWAYIAATRRDP